MRPGSIRRLALLGLSALLTALPARGAEPPNPPEKPEKEPGIQDNLFLLEESYNQDPGVVQHISTFSRSRGGDWLTTFTQEWPVGGIAHQLSYSLARQRLGVSPDGRQGWGDTALNYRYQLLGDGDARFAVSPRFTVFLPTGDERQGRGAGAVGCQVGLPASLVLNESWVSHTVLGLTYTPRARSPEGEKADVVAWSLGQAFVWLAGPRINGLVEIAYTRGQAVAGPHRTAAADSWVVSPGVRWSYNLPGDLQIVPGIAFPIGVGPSAGQRSVLLYLSFEHPFQKTRQPG